MFSLPVNNVSKTKIMCVRMLDASNKKPYILTTYGNSVAMDASKYHKNAMVFCVPCAKKELEVLDSKETWADELHSKVGKGFDDLKPVSKGMFFGSSNGTRGLAMGPPMQVFRAGSYIYSIASDLKELRTFDKEKFTLSDQVLDKLGSVYGETTDDAQPSSKCFLLLQFDAMSQGVYHPIMYMYPSDNDTWSIPTRHFHPSDRKRKTESSDLVANDWDHDIQFLGVRANVAYRLVADRGMSAPEAKTNDVVFFDGAKLSEMRTYDKTLGKYNFHIQHQQDLEEYPVSEQSRLWISEAVRSVNEYMIRRQYSVRFMCDPAQVGVLRIQKSGFGPNGDLILASSTHSRFTTAEVTRVIPVRTHEKIWCDHCKVTPIQGVRYLCVSLLDWDLCEACFQRETRRIYEIATLVAAESLPKIETYIAVRTAADLAVAKEVRKRGSEKTNNDQQHSSADWAMK